MDKLTFLETMSIYADVYIDGEVVHKLLDVRKYEV